MRRAKFDAGRASGEDRFGVVDDVIGIAREGETIQQIIRDQTGGGVMIALLDMLLKPCDQFRLDRE